MGFKRRAAGWLIAAFVLLATTSVPARQLWNTPGKVNLTSGQTLKWAYSLPMLSAQATNREVLVSLDERLPGGSGVSLTGGEAGNAYLVLRLLGVPVKTVEVTVREETVLVPGGTSIGVALNMAGVLVVGASDVGAQKSPARAAGLRAGDLIVAAGGEKVGSAAELSKAIENGKKTALEIQRAGRTVHVDVQPVKDGRDGAFRLGAWVRDSTAGVGTLTFVEPKSRAFGALGHAITDADTGTVLTVSEGAVYESRVVDVLPGASGEPGELLGEFFNEALRLGRVTGNNGYGLYGIMDGETQSLLYPDGVPLRTRSEVKTGPATILTTLDGGGVKEYDCEITRLYPQDAPSQRGLAVRITDPDLLRRTSGIVQGMSGSPILQNGGMVGAITHVFINDPTQGYGMYIEWMLEEALENALEIP